MADEVDLANDYIDNAVSRALGKIQRSKETKSCTKFCADCGETIPAARRKLGFSTCIECAREAERRGSQFIDY